MAKYKLDTLKNTLGYGGKKYDEEKSILILNEIGVNSTNSIGETPLIIASYLGRTEIVKIILSQTKNVDFTVAGSITESALLSSCEQRSLETIKLLVEAGANLEQENKYKLTPLSKVFTNLFSDPIPCAAFLISKGAKITDRFIAMGMDWDKEKFTDFLKSIDYNMENLPVATEEPEKQPEEPKIDTFIAIGHLHNEVNDKNYLATAKVIWKKLVPKSGQTSTVQGELLRAIEKLRDEAQRNGNANFNKNCHGILVSFLRQKLVDQNLFDKEITKQLSDDLDRISKGSKPYLEFDLYERITNRIVDWYLMNPDQIPHLHNDKLYC